MNPQARMRPEAEIRDQRNQLSQQIKEHINKFPLNPLGRLEAQAACHALTWALGEDSFNVPPLEIFKP